MAKRHKVLTKAEIEDNKKLADQQNEDFKNKLLVEYKRIYRIYKFKKQQVDSGISLETDNTMLDNKRPIHMLKSDVELIKFDLDRLIRDMKLAGAKEEEFKAAFEEI